MHTDAQAYEWLHWHVDVNVLCAHSKEDRGDLFLGYCDKGGYKGPVADEVTKVHLFFHIEIHNAHVIL